MKLTSLTVGSIGTNCYMIYQEDSKAAVVIDPSDEAELVEARIAARGLEPRAILLTHGHFDHGGDLDRLLARWPVPVYCHPAQSCQAEETWLFNMVSTPTPQPGFIRKWSAKGSVRPSAVWELSLQRIR